MEPLNPQFFQHPRSCFTALPPETYQVKKEHDFFLAFWTQWGQSLGRELPQQPRFDQCKVEENPAYTFHGSQCAPSDVKQQSNKSAEPIESILQRRAICLAYKTPRNQSERQELLRYRTFRLSGYLLKKSRRNFDKKIVYATRKQVADRRIRFQGKFINEDQAMKMLGLHGPTRSFQQLKEMMRTLNKN